jgi:hypothetical protein
MKMFVRDKRSSLFWLSVNEEKNTVIKSWHKVPMLQKLKKSYNKLACLPVEQEASQEGECLRDAPLRQAPATLINIRLGWKGLPGTNDLAYFLSLFVT